LPEPEPTTSAPLGRGDLGFLLAKATQRWNELLATRFAAAGFADVRPSYGSVLLPLYEQDGLRMGELARRARLSKQTMTTLIPRLERDRLVERRPDPSDARAQLVFLTSRSREFAPVAAETLRRLDGLARRRLGAERLAAAADALRELMELEETPARRRGATGSRLRSSDARPGPR
jgi:DNA-binding MarR family transcriptional regulator